MAIEFEISTMFPVSPDVLYAAWLDSQSHTAMTGGEARVSDQVGETFTAWNGYIHGRNLILEPNQRIVQAWRTAEFVGDEADSHLEITLIPVDGGTRLTLHHANLPAHGMKYREGWVDAYFEPMAVYFANPTTQE